MTQEQQKQAAAKAAIQFVEDDSIIGVGTGSTANYFIEALSHEKHRIKGAVASSEASASLLRSHGIEVFDLNNINDLSIYVDGADESNKVLHLIKGGGGALTREKIVAAVADKFICIVDETKLVSQLGAFPLAIEVIPMARSFVARELVKLGGDPVYRTGFSTDNGNIILDVHHLKIDQPVKMENAINSIVGVVSNGLFALRHADVLLVGTRDGVKSYY